VARQGLSFYCGEERRQSGAWHHIHYYPSLLHPKVNTISAIPHTNFVSQL